MKNRTIPAPPELFRSPLPLCAAGLYALGALFGLVAVGALFLPGSVSFLTEDLGRGGITDPSSLRTWTVIHVGVIGVGFVCAVCMAVGLIAEYRKKGQGLDLLHECARWLLWAVYGSGACVLALMIWKLVRYLWACLWVDDGIYLAYVMLVPEAVMIAQAVGMFFLVRRFLDSACGCTISMAYTRVCGKLDSYTIPGFCSTGFLLAGAVNGYLALERMTTVTIIEDYGGDYYSILLAAHPVLVFTAGMFACGAVANVLMGLYLKRYKRDAERLVFRSMRRTLEDN